MNYIVLLLFFVFSATFAQAKTIHFVLSKDEPIYHQAYKTIQAELSLVALAFSQDKQLITSFSSESVDTTDLIVTVGNKAAQEIGKLGLTNPIIFSFVDNASVPRLGSSQQDRQWAAIVLNQPARNLVSVAQQLIKDSYKNKILVVVSQTNQKLITELNAIELQGEASLQIVSVADGGLAAKTIEPYLFDAGVLVAVHDKEIWRGNSAKWLLQQAFTHKTPVVGYSKSFLVAGALASVYSPSEIIAKQCAISINHWSSKGKLTKTGVIYSPAMIEVNSNIARALRFPISKIDSLSVEQ